MREFSPGGFGPRSKREAPAPPRDARPAKAASKSGAARAPKKKAERPKFDVTCVGCGNSAQVPFNPLEGRDVFCQPCYKARRAVAPEGASVGASPTQPDAMAPPSEESLGGAAFEE